MKNQPLSEKEVSPMLSAMMQLVDGLICLEESANIIHADEYCCELLHHRGEKLLQMNLREIAPALSASDWRERWAKLAQGQTIEIDQQYRTSDGRYPSFTLRCKMAQLGQRAIAVGLIRPSETTSAAMSRSFDTIGQYFNMTVWYWDLLAGHFEVSPSFYPLMGISPTLQIEPVNILKLLHNVMEVKEIEEMQNLISMVRKEKVKSQKIIHIQKGGERVPFQFVVCPEFKSDHLVRLIGAIYKIVPTALMIGEHAQNASYVLERSPYINLIVTPDGRIQFANQAAIDYLKYGRDELLHEQDIFSLDVDCNPDQWEKKCNAIESEINNISETVFQKKDGTVFPVRITLVHLGKGSVSLQAIDITHERKKEARIQAALVEANSLGEQLKAENLYLYTEANSRLPEIVSQSKTYKKILKQIEQVAPFNTTVLIQGETGTGKELLARAIYRLSKRADKSFIRVDCATLPASLIESELFGHERGAFTGADRKRQGRFELADGGTIFLDEIGEVPFDIQVKLLRVLQEGEFEPLGSNQTIKVNVRVIAATNRDLEKMVAAKTFREDLFYRLSVFPIRNLPLRERKDDIPLLIAHFVKKYSRQMDKHIQRVRPEDVDRLARYAFPGNIRELENIIERAVILSAGKTLDLTDWQSAKTSKPLDTGDLTMEEVQRNAIVATLKKTNWRVSGKGGAAEILDMHPQTLFSRMRKLRIERSYESD